MRLYKCWQAWRQQHPYISGVLTALGVLITNVNLEIGVKTMQKLEGKVAVVSGASRGIGASIAKHMAAEGAAVVVNYASSNEGADRVVADIEKNGGRAIAVQADVAKKADIERLFSEAKKRRWKQPALRLLY